MCVVDKGGRPFNAYFGCSLEVQFRCVFILTSSFCCSVTPFCAGFSMLVAL